MVKKSGEELAGLANGSLAGGNSTGMSLQGLRHALTPRFDSVCPQWTRLWACEVDSQGPILGIFTLLTYLLRMKTLPE